MFRETPLVDGHAHLEELKDLPQALQEARASGVYGIIAVGIDKTSNTRVLEIAKDNLNHVYPALGYHPWEVKEEEIEENLSFIQNHIKNCIALGEVGLDYKVKVKKELQWKVFDAVLDFANKYDKPVIIHCRFSHSRALKMVKELGVKRAIFHWYSGPLDLLEQLLSLGYYISATPALQYSPPHQAAIKKAPLEKILLETDTPVVYQGKESRPKDVKISLAEVSRVKGLDPQTVARQTTFNASQFFRIPLI